MLLLFSWLVLLSSCTMSEVAGTYCRNFPLYKECLHLAPNGSFTQVFQTPDSTLTYEGVWHLEANGGRIVFRTLREAPVVSAAQEEGQIVNVVMGYNKIIMNEDQPEYNYQKEQ